MSDVFKDNPNMKSYFQTSDGTKFYDENSAKNHGKTLQDQSVEEVKRSAKIEDSKATKADDILKLVPDMNLETANEYLTAENALKSPRKTVVDALIAKVAELDKPAE